MEKGDIFTEPIYSPSHLHLLLIKTYHLVKNKPGHLVKKKKKAPGSFLERRSRAFHYVLKETSYSNYGQ